MIKPTEKQKDILSLIIKGDLSMDELSNLLDMQPHSLRGRISELRAKGFNIETRTIKKKTTYVLGNNIEKTRVKKE